MKKILNLSTAVLLVLSLAACKKESPIKEIPDNAVAKTQLKEINACSSPPQFWGIRTVGGVSYDSGNDIIFNASGMVALVGEFQSTVDFDPGPGVKNLTADNGAYFNQWFDGNGKFVNAVIKSPSTITRQDKEGNKYEIVFEDVPGSEIDGECINYPQKLALVKTGLAGNILWKKYFANGITNGCYLTLDYEVDHTGNTFINYGGGWHKYSPAGDKLTFTSPATGMGYFWLDEQGNIFFQHNAYRPDPEGGVSKYDGKTSKEMWYLNIPFTDMDFDNLGNVFLTGTFSGTHDFNPGSGSYNLTATVPNTMFIQKLDANGSFHWAKKLGVGNPRTVKLDPNGKYIFVAGSFKGTQAYAPVTGNVKLSSKGQTDAFIIALKQCQ